jgi:hypothetical protein
MAKARQRVNIQVDSNYFHKVFEPNRRKLQAKLGLSNLSCVSYTAYLAQPKLSNTQQNMKFAPRKKKGGDFGYTFY